MPKKIKFNEPIVFNDAKNYLLKVVNNKVFADGEFQFRSEKKIKKLINCESVNLTQSCSSALEVSMILSNIKKGDEVILPSYTFTSTANCVLLRNAKPVFADISVNDINLDINSVEKKITKRTKAIIVVHYGGVSCDMDKFLKLKKKYNLILIEDAAHAFLGKYKNKYLGTIGDFGAFSFHASKNIVGGQCGALVINNKKFVKRADVVLDKGTNRRSLGKKNYYSWQDIGSEYRSPELSAALVYSQLNNIKQIQNLRKKIWIAYYRDLKKLEGKVFYIPYIRNKDKTNAYHTFPVIFNNIKIRDKFIKFMSQNKILCHFHYYPLHMSNYGRKLSKTKLKNTEKVYNGLVRLPIYPSLSQLQVMSIIQKFQSFIKKNSYL